MHTLLLVLVDLSADVFPQLFGFLESPLQLLYLPQGNWRTVRES